MSASYASPQSPKSPAPQGEAVPASRGAIVADRGFQFREMMPLAVFAGMFVLLAIVVVFYPMNRNIDADPNPAIQAVLGSLMFRLEFWLVPLLVVSAMAGLIAAVLRARRIARPVEQIRAGLAQLGLGPAAPFRVRKGDEFADLEPAFSSALNRIEQLNHSHSDLLRFLRRNLDTLAQRAAAGQLPADQLRESLAAMLRDVDAELKKHE